jgi:hypothetical protein
VVAAEDVGGADMARQLRDVAGIAVVDKIALNGRTRTEHA